MQTSKSIENIRVKILVVFLFTLILRLLFLNWNSAEYTDGIQDICMYHVIADFHPPLYSFLIQIFNLFIPNPETGAKLVSILSGTLALFPIYFLAKRVYNERVGYYAILLYSVTPLALRWNIRVMSYSLFSLLFLVSLLYFIKFYDKRRRIDLILFTFLSGLAALTRYQGLVFLLFLFGAYFLYIKEKGIKSALSTLHGWGSWFILLFWISRHGFAQAGAYGTRLGMEGSIFKALIMLETYLISFPYILTYPVFILACYGLYKSNRGGEKERLFNKLFYLLLTIWLIAHSLFLDFETRYFLEIIPLFLILAALGIDSLDKKKVKLEGRRKRYKFVLVICIMVSFLFSICVLGFQKDMFGDIKRSALYLKENLAGERIFSDEYFKTAFWSGARIEKYEQEKIKPGSYLVLHSFYTDLKQELAFLDARYKIKSVYTTNSSIRPLLPDIMSSPDFTHHSGWMIFKYHRQNFKSIIIRVEDKLG